MKYQIEKGVPYPWPLRSWKRERNWEKRFHHGPHTTWYELKAGLRASQWPTKQEVRLCITALLQAEHDGLAFNHGTTDLETFALQRELVKLQAHDRARANFWKWDTKYYKYLERKALLELQEQREAIWGT